MRHAQNMNGPTHMAFGSAFAVAAAGPLHHFTGVGPETPEVWGMFAAAAIGSVAGLLPDIDEPNAMLGRGSWMPRAFGPAVRLLTRIASLPIMAVGYLLRGTLGHRGGTHSLAMAVLFTLALAFPITAGLGGDGDWIIAAIFLGYLSHIIADSMTRHGCPWFWPLLDKDRCQHLLPSPMRITTTTPPSFMEMRIKNAVNLVTIVCLLMFGVLVPLEGLM